MTTKPSADVILEFLTEVFGEQAPGWLTVWSAPSKRTQWVPSYDLAVAAKAAATIATKEDVYFGLGLQEQVGTPETRGRTDGVVAIPGVWVELDAENGQENKRRFPTVAVIHKFLEGLPMKPTMRVESGHGVHAYWLFRELLKIANTGERATAGNLVRGWQSFIREQASRAGYDVDSTHDLARVLRLPGTVNRKSKPCAVKLVVGDGPRYNSSDFSEFGSPGVSNGADIEASAMAAQLILNADCQPPVEKFQVLLANDHKFKRTWNGSRPDLKDQSPSSFCMALADIAVRAGWLDHEVADLMVAYRRRICPDKLRINEPKWYARTILVARRSFINKARAAQAEQEMTAALDAIASDDSLQPDEKLGNIRKVLGLDITEILQQTTKNEPSIFTVVLGDGEKIALGAPRDFRNQEVFRDVLIDKAHIVMPRIKPEKWDKVLTALLSMCRKEEMPEECADHGALQAMLAEYLERSAVISGPPDGDLPFVKDEDVYVVGSHFRSWCRRVNHYAPDGTEFGRLMRVLRCESTRVDIYRSGSHTSRVCWRVARGIWSGVPASATTHHTPTRESE